MHCEVTEFKTCPHNAKCDCMQRQRVVGRMNSPTFVIALFGMLGFSPVPTLPVMVQWAH